MAGYYVAEILYARISLHSRRRKVAYLGKYRAYKTRKETQKQRVYAAYSKFTVYYYGKYYTKHRSRNYTAYRALYGFF